MIKPYGTQILIKPAQSKQPLGEAPLCEYGEVLAIGDEVKNVKVGQNMGFLIWGVNKLEVDGTTHYFINESSDFILGFIE